ncbi:phosphoribosyl-AMP cyclohydrolase [Pelagibius sp. Alg239-R121]|uniref:phosphoribosyl-AMP cyclohydrolase n=1 Tax=Pelagibius sp. Alg239-R121 TaxID=2993448 RepID=UPI0024A71C1C|nr:phosphoribosyl-AMP cyclohydrolase [Pelagibius sp. Alg239-R121]
MNAMKTWTITTIAAATALAATQVAASSDSITKDEILAAQQAWGAGIVAIGNAKTSGGDYVGIAKKHIDDLYAYGESPVLFKPTKAAANQFRGTEQEALSYFVKGIVSEDKGFAINPWTKVRFENEEIMTDSDSALAMGNYYFTDSAGSEVKVEYSFGYLRAETGELLINLHHSSLPYSVK